MKKNILLFIILAFLVMPVFAQASENESNNDGAAALGMYYCVGDFNGMIGLHYQQWFGNHGLMVSAGITGGNFNAVAEYEYCVYSARFTEILNSRLYLWLLGGVACVNESVWSGSGLSNNKFYVDALVSLGIGMEFVWWKHLSVPMQFGYMLEVPNKTKMSFCFASGVRYRF